MFSNDDKTNVLCLDIGTSRINACVFQEVNHELQLKGVSVVPQAHGSLHNGAIVNISETLAAVQEAVKQAENKAKVSAKDLIIGLSGELAKGMTIKLTSVRSEPEQEIDQQEIKSLLHELQWQAFDTIRSSISEELSISEIELKLVNASVVSIQVDGERVIDPIGMKGKQIQLDIFNCFAPVQHFGQIQNIAVELPLHDLKGVFVQGFAVCHALALNDPFADAVIIDIGAGTTDICVISEGKILGNRSFALAGNSITKRIGYALSTSFDEAEQVKLGYSHETLERRSMMIIREAINDDIDIWLSSLEFSLKELPLKNLPHTFLISGNGAKLPEFKAALKDHPWVNMFPMTGSVEVRELDYSDLISGDFNPDQFDPDFIPSVAVATTASDLLYNHSTLDSMLATIIADKGV